MKQLLHNFSTGETELVEVPCPQRKGQHLLIQTQASLISLGTERMLVSFGRANYVEKALQQPEKVRQVLAKVKTDGLFPTIEAVRAKLDAPMPLGYCNAGIVLEVGPGVEEFRPGDRVISNGGHADVVRVPRNLCCRIPDGVSYETACYTVVSSIALHGVRLLELGLGERVCVMGLGLIGLLGVQLLRSHGCAVLGVDLDSRKCELARAMGADVVDLGKGEDLVGAAAGFSRGRGVDAVLVTASTKSSDPMNQGALICRKRGRIVQVGATGLELDRDALYKKEISVQVSCSYGPGRYDPFYEEQGNDYPVSYVRWTEQRNFEAVLDLMATGRLDVAPLTTHRFAIDDAPNAYDVVLNGRDAMGIVLQYPPADAQSSERLRRSTVIVREDATAQPKQAQIRVGLIGAGAFTSRFILPALSKAEVAFDTVVSSGGVTGTHEGRKHGFARSSTDPAEVFEGAVNLVVVATQHDTHARFAIEALEHEKAVYVEKPLCITDEQLDAIQRAYASAKHPFLMVGFNRRFAPLIVKMKSLLDVVSEPKTFIITVNAGVLPEDHWHQQKAVGGGRVLAEACHFVDLVRFLGGAPITRIEAVQLGENRVTRVLDDKVSIVVRLADGSHGTVHYFGNGSKSFPKERIEAFTAGRVLQLDNFRELRGFGWPGFRHERTLRQDKGHEAQIREIVRRLKAGEPSPIPFEEIVEVMTACFAAIRQAP